METLGPASEVEALSEMLAAIGEDPVENLEELPPSANTALTTLRRTSRDFQEEGHWFNSEEFDLEPNGDGNIVIPDAVISLDGVDLDVIERRPFLYNLEARTELFEGPVTVKAILHLPWDTLPSVARRYVTALAIEKFVDGFPGADAVTPARQRNLMRAKIAFDKAAVRNAGLNLLNNQTIAQLIRRS